MTAFKGTTLAATFADKLTADAALAELKGGGFHEAWMAVTKPARGDETTATVGSDRAFAQHAVAESSDGVIGAVGRYFSGEVSLRRALVEHGLSETEAVDIDESVPAQGAVVVVNAGDRSDEAASILSGGAIRVLDAQGETFEHYPSRTDTVPGQGDELDRGTDVGRSGGGLGATTGFWSETAARKDMRANEIGELGDESRANAPTLPDDH